MRRAWWRRKRAWVPGLALAALLGTAAAVVLPALPAIRFLHRLSQPEPSGRWPDRHRHDPRGSAETGDVPFLTDGFSSRSPALVVAHGLTTDGIGDPRLWRLAEAFADAGFGVTIPEVEALVRFGEGTVGAESLDRALDALARARRGRRRGSVGVSVGGALALRAAARETGRDRDAAILLIGAPDDVLAAAREWFRRPDAVAGAPAREAAFAEAGRFARLAVLRTAATRLLAEPDRARAIAWLSRAPGYRVEEAAFRPASEAGRRFVGAASGGAGASDADVEWVVGSVDDVLGRLSPSRFDGELDGLRSPVFLVHGVDDPLVPVEQMERLRARLARRVPVEALPSRLVAHVGIESPGLAETWRHVRFLSRFFDAVRRPPRS